MRHSASMSYYTINCLHNPTTTQPTCVDILSINVLYISLIILPYNQESSFPVTQLENIDTDFTRLLVCNCAIHKISPPIVNSSDYSMCIRGLKCLGDKSDCTCFRARLNKIDGLSLYMISVIKIKRSQDRLAFIMGISLLIKQNVYI